MAGWLSRFPHMLASVALLAALSTDPASGQSTGTIDGTVVDAANGQPIAAAQVFIEALGLGVVTDADGRYSIPDVPAGSHELSAQIVGYLTATEDVTVSAGQATTADLQLNFTALELDELVVTGTSAEASAAELPYSVEVVARRELEQQGSPLVVELVKALSLSHGVVGERQSWYNANEIGSRSPGDRGQREPARPRRVPGTLVLLNGRRQVYLPARLIGGRYVDINAFPSIAIDRIEDPEGGRLGHLRVGCGGRGRQLPHPRRLRGAGDDRLPRVLRGRRRHERRRYLGTAAWEAAPTWSYPPNT